ncbi:MAG: amidohydrolase family protein [Candidatus Bathyarchaeia archaeon]
MINKKVAITNIDKIVSGDINNPILKADTILIENGIIKEVGYSNELNIKDTSITIDANGLVICPGFIDPHVHPPLEDYSPQNRMLGPMEEGCMWGITTFISEGEQGPGLPRFYEWDPQGVKATAILAKKIFDRYRPGGAKVHGGALVLAKGLTKNDFKEMADAGVWLIGEIGGGGLAEVEEVLPMIDWAREYRFFISVHYGPRLIPGATTMTTEDVLKINPNKVAHANGGTTAAPYDQTMELLEKTKCGIEIVTYGNPRMTYEIIEKLKKRGELHRVVFGSDGFTGQGYLPNAIHRAIIITSSMNKLPAEKAIAMGTGNTARLYNLNRGIIEPGKEADLIAIDAPPGSSGENALEAIELGDTFGVAMVMVDGRIVALRGRDTRPVRKWIKINGKEAIVSDINEYLFDPPRTYGVFSEVGLYKV